MFKRHTLLATTALAVAFGSATAARAVPAIALVGQTSLFSFDTTTPGISGPVLAITGLSAGDTLLGIDFRPATGQLYALGRSGSLYTIAAASGMATFASTVSTPLSAGDFDISFNPTVDRLRIVGTSGQNLRVNVDTGAATVDGSLAYAAGDQRAGTPASIVGAGYTTQVAGAASTTLYDLDSAAATLVVQNPPNNGTLNTVGALGVSGIISFDIDSAVGGTAYAASASTLYSVNLTTGAATSIGTFARSNITDFALTPVPEPMTLGLLGTVVAGLAVGRRRRLASR